MNKYANRGWDKLSVHLTKSNRLCGAVAWVVLWERQI